MYSTSEVETALLRFAEDNLDEGSSYGAFLNSYSDLRGTVHEIPELGPVTIVDYHEYDSDKNYDGWSEKLYIIFDLCGILYRATGTYTSYVGSEWNDTLTIVEPRNKTVIEYVEAA